RMAAMAGDETNGLAAPRVGQVLILFNPVAIAEHRQLPAFFQRGRRGLRGRLRFQFARGLAVEVSVGAAEKAVILIEASLHRMVLRAEAQVPFADRTGCIAGFLEPLGNRRFGERQSEVGSALRSGIKLMSEPLLVAAGEHTGARRTAKRGGHVSAR